MTAFKLFADSSCDLTPSQMEEWGILHVDMTFMFEDSDREYQNYELSAAEFYAEIREGRSAKTAAVNVLKHREAFAEVLNTGADILYIGFSSGLSSSYQNAVLAAEELKEEYPGRKIMTVDSLCASAGYGLLLYLVSRNIRSGASLEEAAAFAEATKGNICHWFTVNDIDSLLRGGRVKTALATVGGILGIKPVMHMDENGKLVPVSVVRGRRASLKALADRYGQLALTPGMPPVFISHADCIEDVKMLSEMLRTRYDAETEVISDIGPVIGSHTGSGTISLFFVGKER